MKGETKLYDTRDGTMTAAKRDISNNTYLVTVKPHDSGIYSHTVTVYADTVRGNDHGFPKTIGTISWDTKYDKLCEMEVKHNQKLASVISKAVNVAVTKLTDTLEDIKSNEDAVLGALEANANVHEGDE